MAILPQNPFCALCDRCGFPSRSRVRMQASVVDALEPLKKARVEKSTRKPPHPIVGRDRGVWSAHAYATLSAALSHALLRHGRGAMRLVMSSVRTALPGSP